MIRTARPLVVVTLATLLTAAGCASRTAAAPSDAGPVAAYPFHARAANARGEVTEELRGVAYVMPAQVRVVVQSGRLPVVPAASTLPVAVVATLAYGDTATAWNHRRRGDRRLLSALPVQDGALSDSVVFVIPKTAGLDLRQHWVSFEYQARIKLPTTGTWHEATRPIHADLQMFAAPASAR